MAVSQARSITSNQIAVHDDLHKLLARHKANEFKRPIAQHTQQAFCAMLEWLGTYNGDVILDACCGVGESTINIAAEYPEAKVIGVDKSTARLEKHRSYVDKVYGTTISPSSDSNYLLIQADLHDFWRLFVAYIENEKPTWKVIKQFILYPNPYPKKAQLGKRWHASAIFPFIVKLCPNIEVRSNWLIYLEEFAQAAVFYNLEPKLEAILNSVTSTAYTPFERKYQEAGQTCYKLVILPCGSDK